MTKKKSALRQEFFNLPNILTIGRIVLIPLVLYFLAGGTPRGGYYAALLFALASVTDALDGYLARKWNLITVTGKFLDPLADKILVMAILVMLVSLGRIPVWLVVILLTREISITALRSIASSEGLVIAAGSEGKIKTALQLVAILFLCVHYRYPVELIFSSPEISYHVVGYWLLLISLGFSLFSAMAYIRSFYRAAVSTPSA